MKTLIYTTHILLAIILFTSGCSIVRPSWVDENSYIIGEDEKKHNDSILPDDIGPLGGHFDENGKWIPDDQDVEITYKIPDISAGFIFDISSMSVSPAIQVELFEVDTKVPYVRRLKFDIGIAYRRSFVYVGKLWTSIFEISTGGFVGWNWEDRQASYGIAFTVIKF